MYTGPGILWPVSLVQSCYYMLELLLEQEDTFDIVVPLSGPGVQLLCGIVDNVEALIDEWFPGLRDVSVISGAELIKPMSICPYCPCKWCAPVVRVSGVPLSSV